MESSGDHWNDCNLDNREAIQLGIENKCATPSTNIEDCQVTQAIEQHFFKSENDQSTEDMSVLNRIKSEVNDWDEFGNDEELALKMDREIKEEPMVDGEDPYVITETDLKRIKEECSENNFDECAAQEFQFAAVKQETDMESEDFKATEITEECSIKTDSEASSDAVADMTSNSRMKVHANCSESGKSSQSHITTKAGTAASHEFYAWMDCDAIFKSKAALDDHIVRKHPDSVTTTPRKIYKCSECPYRISLKSNFNKHLSLMHSEIG
nr:unnamed protein product [Callosobruchus analis]